MSSSMIFDFQAAGGSEGVGVVGESSAEVLGAMVRGTYTDKWSKSTSDAGCAPPEFSSCVFARTMPYIPHTFTGKIEGMKHIFIMVKYEYAST